MNTVLEDWPLAEPRANAAPLTLGKGLVSVHQWDALKETPGRPKFS